ncbi:MAG: hypothetical protein PHF17_00160 [Arcobacteraceae bacterium]|nr:hypothetical protein [Arcobacteraceae bacterium]
MKKINLITIPLAVVSLLFGGCASKYEQEQQERALVIQKEADKLGLTVSEYKNYQEKEQQKVEAEKQKAIFDRIAQYEIDYLKEYEDIKKQIPELKIAWVQPKNKKEDCKVYVDYHDKNPTLDESYKLFWDGECKDGYAYGLGREIVKANLEDNWQIGIYEKGIPTGGIIIKDNLHNVLTEGEANYGGSMYAVTRVISEENRDINIVYKSGISGSKNEPALFVATSPFWNQTQVYQKAYPNFCYGLAHHSNNDEQTVDFLFSLYDKNGKRHGWAIEKNKNQNMQTAEYINGNRQTITFPKEYNGKADEIISEISQAEEKAFNAQNQAQLVKKQYLRKICKESVKVNFMDNEEYKEVCDDKAEKELMAKIDAKLQKLTQAKIVRIEQKKQEQQQLSEQLYRQQQLAIQQRQVEEQESARNSNQVIQGINQLTQNLNNINYNSQIRQQNFQLQQLNNNLMYKKW